MFFPPLLAALSISVAGFMAATGLSYAVLAVGNQLAQNAGMITLDDNGYFITGSDTDVGKTYIACEVIRQLRQRGVDIETRKPAESGCVLSATGDLITHDAAALQQANDNHEGIDRIAPYRFHAARWLSSRLACNPLRARYSTLQWWTGSPTS